MEIKQMLVPDAKKPKYTVNGKSVILSMKPEYITIHETDNPSKGADDLAHARLQESGNSRQASWHLQVDEDSCIQSIPFNECAMHAGDGSNGTGNRKSIAIEICVNQGGNYINAVKNAAEITRQLMAQFNIPVTNVVQHNRWSGKHCPRHLRDGDFGIDWNYFIGLVKTKQSEPKGVEVQLTNTIEMAAYSVLRKEPTASSDIVGNVPAGGKYIVNEVKGDWFNIGGWVHKDQVKLEWYDVVIGGFHQFEVDAAYEQIKKAFPHWYVSKKKQ
jgi:N-acetylmuramoyl-L-alanine amidase